MVKLEIGAKEREKGDGELVELDQGEEISFENIYTRDSLTVIKTIAGNAAKLDDVFEFKATFDNAGHDISEGTTMNILVMALKTV
ncbi:MAG: hypothetical protein GX352_00220 [Clostridiales bacterium]|nr:hypothetical protein [Clostridiales bacterium]